MSFWTTTDIGVTFAGREGFWLDLLDREGERDLLGGREFGF